MMFTIPAAFKGQVLAQHGGYVVRGEFVVGQDAATGLWFWNQTYAPYTKGRNFADVAAAMDSLVRYLDQTK